MPPPLLARGLRRATSRPNGSTLFSGLASADADPPGPPAPASPTSPSSGSAQLPSMSNSSK
eukprot:3705673-Alexandrium_andersonii.AAC.1